LFSSPPPTTSHKFPLHFPSKGKLKIIRKQKLPLLSPGVRVQNKLKCQHIVNLLDWGHRCGVSAGLSCGLGLRSGGKGRRAKGKRHRAQEAVLSL